MPNDLPPALLHRLKQNIMALGCAVEEIGIWIDQRGSTIDRELNLIFHPDALSLVKAVDIVSLQVPLYPSKEDLLNKNTLAQMKRSTDLINCARGKLVERDAVVRALEAGHMAGDGDYPR